MEVHLSPDLQAKLNRIAVSQGRDSETIITEAVERMVNYDDWFLAEVEKGLHQIEQGKTVNHEDVGRRLEAYLDEKRLRA